jgi:hypothetical protein
VLIPALAALSGWLAPSRWSAIGSFAGGAGMMFVNVTPRAGVGAAAVFGVLYGLTPAAMALAGAHVRRWAREGVAEYGARVLLFAACGPLLGIAALFLLGDAGYLGPLLAIVFVLALVARWPMIGGVVALIQAFTILSAVVFASAQHDPDNGACIGCGLFLLMAEITIPGLTVAFVREPRGTARLADAGGVAHEGRS